MRLAKLPLLRNYILTNCWEKRTYHSFAEQYHQWQRIFAQADIRISGKHILEIGAGGCGGVGYFFLREGATRWLSTDQYQDPQTNQRLRKNEARLRAELRQQTPSFESLVQPEFRCFDAAKLQNDLEGKFDLLVSSAFFEHVQGEAVSRIITNMARYLKPEGLMFHEIDLRDHLNVANPHHFLKYTETQWRRLTENSIFYTNRLRSQDFKEAFVGAGLKLVHLDETQVPLPKDLPVVEEFRRYRPADLQTTVLIAILQKP